MRHMFDGTLGAMSQDEAVNLMFEMFPERMTTVQAGAMALVRFEDLDTPEIRWAVKAFPAIVRDMKMTEQNAQVILTPRYSNSKIATTGNNIFPGRRISVRLGNKLGHYAPEAFCHEMIHVRQILDGRLVQHEGETVFDGKPFKNKDVIEVMKTSRAAAMLFGIEGMYGDILPWEGEAFKEGRELAERISKEYPWTES